VDVPDEGAESEGVDFGHAKESNHAALADSDAHSDDPDSGGPLLSIVR
jgi:hypothetical protein